jgi:hypothetical protein
MSNKKVSQFIPESGRRLAKYSAIEMIERVGDEAIREVVASVMCGGNIRSLTESLTRKRLTFSNAALFFTYLQASKNIKNFSTNMTSILSEERRYDNLDAEEKLYIEWMLGLTKKGIQNILRSDDETAKKYLKDVEVSLSESASDIRNLYGELSTEINLGKDKFWLNWLSLLQIFSAVGTQTLALRGSEKSMYGKLFEKLILGAFLTILGFELIDEEDTDKNENVFWLSSRDKKRESDATLLLKQGVGIRFDLGFIGPGNTEISLDKVSRFERNMQFGDKTRHMTTIVLVDRIGVRSRITDLARAINGYIVQMSMTQWVTEVCEILNDETGFTHPIMDLSDEAALTRIEEEVKKLDLRKFLKE